VLRQPQGRASSDKPSAAESRAHRKGGGGWGGLPIHNQVISFHTSKSPPIANNNTTKHNTTQHNTTILQLELPHLNVLSKCDLISEDQLNGILDLTSAAEVPLSGGNPRLNRLTSRICELIDDYSQVSFLPLNINDEDSINLILSHADHCMQFGEDADVKIAADDELGEGEEEY